MLKKIISFFILFAPLTTFAIPTAVNRLDNNHIEPLIRTDYIKAPFFRASSTVFASIFPYASTTALTVSGNSYLGTISSGIWNGSTIGVPFGGTGQTSFKQGWLHSDGTTITSSTSPTVNYITATSTTATSNFHKVAITTTGSVNTPLAVTSTYTGTDVFSGLSNIFNWNTADDDLALSAIGFDVGIGDTYGQTGFIDDVTMERNAFSAALSRTGDSDASGGTFGEEDRAFNAYLFRSGSFTGSGHNLDVLGFDMNVINTVTYNNAGGTFEADTYGARARVSNTGTVVAGNVTRNTYGVFSEAGCVDSGTTACYGVYINGADGADTNYALYSVPNQPSYFAGKLGVGSTTPYSKFAVKGDVGSALNPLFVVASSTNAELFKVNGAGHIKTGGATPSISSCGVSPSISGNDTTGTITVGTGIVTSCTLTFSSPRSGTPRVVGVITGGGLNITGGYSSKSTTAVTFTFAATIGEGAFDYLILE